MARISLQYLSKFYGEYAAVNNLSLEVADGEFVVLLGPSGCGKTTTLRMIAGFAEPTAGAIIVGDRDLTSVPPFQRNLGIVFQNYAIFPHLSALENVAFGLRRRRVDSATVMVKARRALDMVKLGHLAERMPKQLSGGQQQRVAIARALAIEPDVFLLDEPLSNLDAKLRQSVREEMHALQRELGITTVMVTHDQEEALSLGDRLVVMDKGTVQQIGTGSDVYDRPENLFVANFIGSANLLKGKPSASNETFETDAGISLVCRNSVEGATVAVIRPESVTVDPLRPANGQSGATGVLRSVVYKGSHSDVSIELVTAETLLARVNSQEAEAMRSLIGGPVGFVIQPHQPYAINE
ncbi:MAG: ABC transporter ATP-binding protein [Rhizobiaceae bacterium]